MSKKLHFIIIPKILHPWFDEVNKGAEAEAKRLERELDIGIIIDYKPPSICEVEEQNKLLYKVSERKPDGIAIDPVDAIGNISAINDIREQGIPVVLFDSPSPDPGITGIGNNFTQQGVIAAERLVKLLDYEGKVAVMQGFPTAPNHKERYEAQMAILKKHPGITIVDGGIDNDDIETAQQQAEAVIEAHPDLKGYLCCDASGPIGIASAVKNAGKVGKISVVGMDGIKPILEAIKEGIIDSSSATIPRMQGAFCVLMLWRASLGLKLPQSIDTGIDVITSENVDAYLRVADN